MSGPSASGSRGLARLAGLFSLRTIGGKLIIGLALLFGVASVAVSVVTDQSLNHSLMSSLNEQLQAATDTWYTCVQHSTGDPDHGTPSQAAYGPAPAGYGMCSNGGQAPGTFELLLSGTSVVYKNTVKQECLLSVPDEAVLAALPSGPGQPPSGQASPGPPDPPPPRRTSRRSTRWAGSSC